MTGHTLLRRGILVLARLGRWIKAGLRRRGLYGQPVSQSLIEWRAAEGDERLRLDYPLGPSSVVVDVGGYRGQWASDIFARYTCAVHIFEPIPEFCEYLRWRFEHNDKIRVYEVGLGTSETTARFHLSADATSSYRGTGEEVSARTVEAARYLASLGITRVDLMKINIEGGEYPLIQHLAESGFMRRIEAIQVQFHDFFPDAADRLAEAHRNLSMTHEAEYQFRFVWESWSRRADVRPPE